MLTLALDTCDARGSVAALSDGSVLAAVRHESAEDYSSWLLPAVEQVLRTANIGLGDVELFAVAAGPGSFTALRVGLTTVKAWSEIYGRPIAPVSRLEVLAGLTPGSGSWVAAFVDARRAQIYAGLYRRSEAGLLLLGDEEVVSPKTFLARVAHDTDGTPVAWVSWDSAVLESEPGWGARSALGESIFAPDSMLAPAIGWIAERRAREGKLANSLTLDANYVRRSDAELFWKGSAAHGQ